jgi:hypothetical protein
MLDPVVARYAAAGCKIGYCPSPDGLRQGFRRQPSCGGM